MDFGFTGDWKSCAIICFSYGVEIKICIKIKLKDLRDLEIQIGQVFVFIWNFAHTPAERGDITLFRAKP